VSKRASPVAIGAFVVGAIALVVIGLVVFGSVNLFNRPLKVVMYFDESVQGLGVGAPVAYRGVKLGTVTRIRVEVGTTRIAVFANLDPSALAPHPGRHDLAVQLEKAVRDGLRAQLALQSIVTGQLFVSLIILPDSPLVTVGLEPAVLEIPTVPTLLQQFVDRFEKIVNSVQNLPWDQLFHTGLETLEGARDLARSPELARAIRKADAALGDFQNMTRTLEREIGPLVTRLEGAADAARTTLERSQTVLDDAGTALNPDWGLGFQLSQTLRELTEAARSFRALTNYLEQHPDAVLFGRGRPGER
jgi:paraquat-inducible protein B